MNKKISLILGMVLLTIFLFQCEKEKPTSLFDPDHISNLTPVITEITPPNSALAGIVEITISGANFSPVAKNNFVYFGKTKTAVLSATDNQLIVQSPPIVQDSLEVKVAVLDADLFSNILFYSLVQPVWEHGDYGEFDEPAVIACDNEENLYVAVARAKRIDKILPKGVRETYASMSFSIPTGIKMGPEGILYVAQKSKNIHCVLPGNTETQKIFRAPGKVNDFDFAESGVIYGGGDGDNLYLIDPSDSSTEKVAEYTDINIRTVRVFDGCVYVGGKENETGKQYIWRNQILANNELAEKEIYFDWSEKVDPDSGVFALTFAQDGDMYIGTDKSEAIFVVHPDGSYEPLYPGILEPTSNALCWGAGESMYVCRHKSVIIDGDRVDSKTIIKVNMLKNGAPYYGRQ
ncbi:IPT/TIG domain-containing protein [candidate division KSB1 bacterium]|nr:IPT/TIG domain-containing protein [candidate division KSB1 bacterium]